MPLIPIDLSSATEAQLVYRQRMIDNLKACKWNVSKAARKMNLSRASVYRRIIVLGVRLPRQARGKTIFDHAMPKVVA